MLIDIVHIASSFLAGENRYSHDLGRWQIECGIVAGRVYVAETTTGEIVGAAVWFGPGEEVLKSYVHQMNVPIRSRLTKIMSSASQQRSRKRSLTSFYLC